MSDLRECVTGDTLVCLANGERRPIQELVGQTPKVWAVDENHKLVAAESDCVWKVGKRPVFEVKLASGRSITATAKHRILSGEGWKRVAEVQLGERIAIAREIPEPAETTVWPEHALILLGHLVGDGSYLTHQPLRYTTGSEENSAAVTDAARAIRLGGQSPPGSRQLAPACHFRQR